MGGQKIQQLWHKKVKASEAKLQRMYSAIRGWRKIWYAGEEIYCHDYGSRMCLAQVFRWNTAFAYPREDPRRSSTKGHQGRNNQSPDRSIQIAACYMSLRNVCIEGEIDTVNIHFRIRIFDVLLPHDCICKEPLALRYPWKQTLHGMHIHQDEH